MDEILSEIIKEWDGYEQVFQNGWIESESKQRENWLRYQGNQRDMLFFQINNRNLKRLISLIKKYDSQAFIVVSDTKAVQNGFIK